MSPIQDRDWYRGKHPPDCTCVDCNSSKLGKPTKKYQKSELPVCPQCGHRSLFFNNISLDFECLNTECKASGRTIDEIRNSNSNKPNIKNKTNSQNFPNVETVIQSNRLPPVYTKGTTDGGDGKFRKLGRFIVEPIPNYLKAIILVFALSIIGLVTGILIGGLYHFWVLLCFSLVFSIEKWFSSANYRHKWIGKVYRLTLNCLIIATLGFLIWSAINLFSQHFTNSPLAGTMVFIIELAFFIWLWRVVAKNSWRWPSMKLTVLLVLVLFLISAFAGVQPMTSYKNQIFSALKSASEDLSQKMEKIPTPTQTLVIPTTVPHTSPPSTAIRTYSNSINPTTGIYKNYYIGLVNTPDGNLGGNGCYDDTGRFIVLINNQKAVNPTYSQLLSFLQGDKTDEFPYTYKLSVAAMYYGTAESHVDLKHIQNIIDGITQPDNPNVCADFAERLHNNAEIAGIRCGYISLDMSGYTDPSGLGIPADTGHALVIFQTSDKGLVYIDDTGDIPGSGPANHDRIVDVKVGEQYNPQFLFPEGGWFIPSGVMGTVTDIFTTWDGKWN
jgi:hypothetical protein